jgi:hypothetical protein
MNSCDVYIVAPIAKLTCDEEQLLGSNIFKLYEVINSITNRYNTKVDIYSLAKVKINSVPENCKKIDEAACSIIVTPSENVHDFMILIGYAIARNKRIYILLLDNKTHDSKAGIIADGYENVYVDCVNPLLNDYNRLERFILSSVGERSECNA